MTVKITRDTVTLKLKALIDDIEDMPAEAHRVWLKNTPKRTGNARKRTKLKGNTINANYGYAQPLDEGWSKQSPEGMFKPTVEHLKKWLKKKVRK